MLDDNAGKITTFVGEGDVWYNNDYLAHKTGPSSGTESFGDDNSETNPDNVFNTTSMGLRTNNGIDIDTWELILLNGQYITWSSDLLKARGHFRTN